MVLDFLDREISEGTEYVSIGSFWIYTGSEWFSKKKNATIESKYVLIRFLNRKTPKT